MTSARGTFDVSIVPASPELEGAVGRFEFDKTFHGDLEGESAGIMLTAGDRSTGSAGYAAIEVVRGVLNGRRGSIAFAQLGLMHAGEQSLRYEVVPGSADGELAGLTGHMALDIDGDGTHRYELTYEG